MTILKLQQDDFIFRGKLYWLGEICDGYLYISKGKIVDFMEEHHAADICGILLPKFFNAHIHILDSSSNTEPPRDLLSAVGCNGFKWKILENIDWNYYRRTLEFMKKTGTGYYVEFHESQYADRAKQISSEMGMVGIILGRVKSFPDGVGWSTSLGEPPKTEGILGLHHSEGYHEDIEIALSYRPHHLVHMNHATKEDLKICIEENVPIVVTPRSYLYFSLPIRIREFVDMGAILMLGTDNCMVSSPDMRVEAEIFWKLSGIRVEEVLKYLYKPYEIFLGKNVLDKGSEDWIIFEESNIYRLVRDWSFHRPVEANR